MANNPLAESWTYQQTIQEGFEKGLEKGIVQGIEKGREEGIQEGMEKGIEQGLEKGKLEGLQTAVLSVVEARFPPLVELAQQRVSRAKKLDEMNIVLRGVAQAPDEATARLLLELLAA